MSRFAIIPASAVLDRRLSLRELSVLAAIGMHTDRNGWCFPSSERLGEILGVSGAMVRRSIGVLQEHGYLEVRARRNADGGRTSNLIRVRFDAEHEQEALREATPVTSEVTTPVTSGVTAPVTSGVTGRYPINVPKEGISLSGAACLAMRQAGLVATNPTHPELLAALAEGVTPEELADIVTEHPGKPMAYVLAVARRRKAEPPTLTPRAKDEPANPFKRRRGESLVEHVERVNRIHDEREDAATRAVLAPDLGADDRDVWPSMG